MSFFDHSPKLPFEPGISLGIDREALSKMFIEMKQNDQEFYKKKQENDLRYESDILAMWSEEELECSLIDQRLEEEEKSKESLFESDRERASQERREQEIYDQELEEASEEDPFDKAFAREWEKPLHALAKGTVENLSDPLAATSNEKLQRILEEQPELKDKLEEKWEDSQRDIREGLSKRATPEKIREVVPYFRDMPREQAAKEFKPVQERNTAIIISANYVKYFMEMDKLLKQAGSSLQEVFGQSAVKLGVKCSQCSKGLSHYNEKLQKLGHDFSEYLQNHVHKAPEEGTEAEHHVRLRR